MRDSQRRDRNHEAREDRPPEQAPPRKLELRNCVARPEGHRHDNGRHGSGGDEGIEVPDPNLRPHQHMDVSFEREVLRPKLHARPHHFVLRLERGHEPPIERERPEDRKAERGKRDDDADEIHMAQAREPAGCERGGQLLLSLDRDGHRSPRARRSWNCSTEAMTITKKSTTDAAAARPPLFTWNPCFKMYCTITIVASVRTFAANRVDLIEDLELENELDRQHERGHRPDERPGYAPELRPSAWRRRAPPPHRFRWRCCATRQ